MRGRIAAAIEGLTARGSPPRGIVGRNHMLARTASLRPGVGEKPGEAAAVSWGG